MPLQLVAAQTVINVPPSFAPSAIGAGTTLNLLDGGTIGNLHGTSGSQINVLGGQANAISGGAGSVVNMSGGRVLEFHVEGIGAITGGVVANQFNWDGSTTTISGGAIGSLGAQDDASLNIVGVDFALNGVPLSGLTAAGDSLLLDLVNGDTLTGLLADGTPFGHYQFEAMSATTIANGALRLTLAETPASPTPGVIEVSDYSTLQAVGAGQTLRLKSGGVLPGLFRAGAGSTVEVLGGHTGNGMYAISSSVLVDGGTIGHNFRAFDGTTVTLKSGRIEDAQFLKGTTLNVEGGEFVGLIMNGAAMNASGGVVYRAYVQNGGVANVSGGQINELGGGEGSTLNVSGGNFTKFSSYGGVANVVGGTYNDDFFDIRGDAALTLNASGFRLNGNLLTNLDNSGSSRTVTLGPTDVLSGVFDDGTPFIFSGFEGSIEEPVKLVRSAGYAPGPALINVPADAAPAGVRQGQTLTLNDGGALPENFSAIHGSSVQVNGGTVGSNFEVLGATVHASGGVFDTIDVFKDGVINIAGTTQWGGLDLFQGAVANISGGVYGGGNFFNAHPGSVLNISGGEFRGVWHAENAEVNISGGTVSTYRHKNVATTNSRVNLSGGHIQDLDLYDGAKLNATGGSIDVLQVGGTSEALIDGARIASLAVTYGASALVETGSIGVSSTWNGGKIVFHGGALGDQNFWQTGEVELHGVDFQVDGVAIPGLNAVGDSVLFSYEPGTDFTALLADGTPLAMMDEKARGLETGGVVRLIRAVAPTHAPLVDVSTVDAPFGAAPGQTVRVYAGGELAPNFIAGPGSTVEIQDGVVGENFEADRSNVLIAGGVVGENLDVFKDAVVEVAGGSVGRYWEVHNHGQLSLTGGTLGSQGTLRGGTLNVSGGATGSIDALDQSVVNVSGGEIGSELELQGGSQANVTGGAIGYNFRVGTSSTAHIAGGQLQFLDLQATGAGEFTGGITERLAIAGGGIANIRGGAFGDGFDSSATAQVAFFGDNFEVNGFPLSGLEQVGNEITLIVASNALFTGTLADGTPFAFDSRESDRPRTLTLKRTALAAADAVVEVSSPNAPLGIRAGQQLNLRAGGKLADSFNVGRGAELNVYDGVIGKNLEAYAATVNIYGGQIGGDFDAFTGSAVNVYGGQIGGNFDVYSGATLNFHGGHALQVDAIGSTVAVEGGKIRSLYLSTAANVDWRGGYVDGFTFNGTGNSLDLFGVDFKLNGVPIAGLGAVGDSVPFNPNVADVLTGMLADGSPVVFRASQASVPVGAIRLNRTAIPAPNLPAFQQVVDANAPFGIGAGQTLQLGDQGVLAQGFIAGAGSTLLIDDGLVNSDLKAFGANLRITGGTLKGNLQLLENVTADIRGGVFEGTSPVIMAGSNVTLRGTQFFLNNVPIADLSAPGSWLNVTQRNNQMLKAILADGSTLQWRLQPFTLGGRGPTFGISEAATLRIQMIPEPSAVALLAIVLAAGAPHLRRSSK